MSSLLLVSLVLGLTCVFGATINNSSVNSLDSSPLQTTINIFTPKSGLHDVVLILNERPIDDEIQQTLAKEQATNEEDKVDTPIPTAATEIPDLYATEPTVDYKILCFLAGWRESNFPVHTNPTSCTHISLLGFAYLTNSDFGIEISLAEIDDQLRNRMLAYKNNAKLLLTLGGWWDMSEEFYAGLAGSVWNRRKFVKDVLRIIEQNGFDGLDVAWGFPVCHQGHCEGGYQSEKEDFSLLIEELSLALKPKGYLLTAVVSPNTEVIDTAYDAPALTRFLDWILVLSYDIHGLNYRTGHVAPLYDHPGSQNDWHSVNSSINYWISKGVPSRKIVMGIPFFGRSFTLNNPEAGVGLNAPAVVMAEPGECSTIPGKLAYSDICERIYNRGWTVVRDPLHRVGPYAYKGSDWVAFDDADMIRRKSKFIRDMNLGGGFIWALNFDDFEGKCGEEVYPLMHTLCRELSNAACRSRFLPIEGMEGLTMWNSQSGADSLIFSKHLSKLREIAILLIVISYIT